MGARVTTILIAIVVGYVLAMVFPQIGQSVRGLLPSA